MPFVKGQIANPEGRPVGAKNRDTLLKEERRAIFEKEVSKAWEKTIAKLRPEYVADQFMGKAPEEVKISGELNNNSFTAEEIALIKSGVKKKLANDEG
jgi:hypothetical protein